MANVLVISGSYYPYATANAACMKEFEKSLIESGHTVTYLIKQHDLEDREFSLEDGVEIYHVPNKVNKFYKKIEGNKKKGLFYKIYYLFIKVIFKIYATLFYGSTRNFSIKTYLKLYAKKIKELVKEKEIELIISVSVPFLSHQAVLEYLKTDKKSQVKWLVYVIDAYSQKINISNVNAKIKEEYKIFDRADKLLFLSVLKNDYTKGEFIKYLDKMSFLPIPTFTLDKADSKSVNKNEGKITCVYAGTLYDDSSSLDYFIKFFKMANLQDDVKFHFMGKRQKLNESYLLELQNIGYEVVLDGFMPISYAENAVENADLVLNIGNLSTNQIPSKIFNYMAVKKPILTFYRIKEDTSIPYLIKYPLAFNVFEDEKSLTKDSVKKVKEFILNSREARVDIEVLKEIYKEDLRDKVCKDFIEIISEII